MGQIIKRGIIQSFDASTYTASLLLLEATSEALVGVPVSNTLDGTSGLVGALCAVLFFDEHNPTDAVVIAVFANASVGLPVPPPGRVTITNPVQQLSNVAINGGTTQTFTLSGLPTGILAVLFKVYFTSATAPTHLDLAAHGGNLNQTASVGELQVAGDVVNGGGVLPVDGSGRIDIRANGGTCTVNLFTFGYVI